MINTEPDLPLKESRGYPPNKEFTRYLFLLLLLMFLVAQPNQLLAQSDQETLQQQQNIMETTISPELLPQFFAGGIQIEITNSAFIENKEALYSIHGSGFFTLDSTGQLNLNTISHVLSNYVPANYENSPVTSSITISVPTGSNSDGTVSFQEYTLDGGLNIFESMQDTEDPIVTYKIPNELAQTILNDTAIQPFSWAHSEPAVNDWIITPTGTSYLEDSDPTQIHQQIDIGTAQITAIEESIYQGTITAKVMDGQTKNGQEMGFCDGYSGSAVLLAQPDPENPSQLTLQLNGEGQAQVIGVLQGADFAFDTFYRNEQGVVICSVEGDTVYLANPNFQPSTQLSE